MVMVTSNCVVCGSNNEDLLKSREIVDLKQGDKFMQETYLRQPGFTYSSCGPFTKNEEKIKKSR